MFDSNQRMRIKVMCVSCGDRFEVDEFNPQLRYVCMKCRTVRCASCHVETLILASPPDGRDYICHACAGATNPNVADVAFNKVTGAAKAVVKRIGDRSASAQSSGNIHRENSALQSGNVASAKNPVHNNPCPPRLSANLSNPKNAGPRPLREPRTERCSNCTALTTAGSRFCNNCGQQLVANPSTTTACPDCMKLVSIDAQSCLHCGAAGPFYPRNPQQALLRAINAGDAAMVSTLISRGEIDVNANITPAGDTITTPLDAAEAWGQHLIVNLLHRLGGRRGDPDCPMDDIPPETVDAISALVGSHVRRGEDSGGIAPGKKTGERPTTVRHSPRTVQLTCLCSGILIILSGAMMAYAEMNEDDHSKIDFAEMFWSFILVVAFSTFIICVYKLTPKSEPNDPFKGYLRLGDGFQPILKTIVSILLAAAGIWLFVAGYFVYSGFQSGPDTGSGQIGYGALNVVLAIITLAVVSIPVQRKCPHCSRWLAAVHQSSHLIDRSMETENVTIEDRHYSTRGDYVGSTKRQGQQVVTVEKHLNAYECRYCRHEWTGISVTRSS